MEGYRKNAADVLKSVPKDERKEKLAEFQKTDEYWTARVNKLLDNGQRAEFSEDRKYLHWNVKSVYHGTDIPEIEDFTYAEESTIGNKAIYFTTDPSLAMGYAHLRNQEREGGKSYLYEAMLKDVNLMNWAERVTVEKLKKEYLDFCITALKELGTLDYTEFQKKYEIWENLESGGVLITLEKIISTCEKPDVLHNGNIKFVAQGIMGIFFEKFVKDSGYDGVITIEGGDDTEFTTKAGISVVIFNKDKVIFHRAVDVTR